jgi:DHA1 family inner membrane transport protein
MQMRVMKYGKAAPELAATANISAFNVANALGGLIGGAVVDSAFGAAAIPFAAAVLPVLAFLFILSQEQRSEKRRSSAGAALPSMEPSACASR